MTTYTLDAQEMLGEFVVGAGKTFLTVQTANVFGEPTKLKSSRLFCDFSAVLTSIQEQFQFTIGKPRGMN